MEGGTNTIYQFMNQNLWDEARVFVNPHKNFMHGLSAPEINLDAVPLQKVGKDLLYTIKNE